jgi:hypothetical protein
MKMLKILDKSGYEKILGGQKMSCRHFPGGDDVSGDPEATWHTSSIQSGKISIFPWKSAMSGRSVRLSGFICLYSVSASDGESDDLVCIISDIRSARKLRRSDINMSMSLTGLFNGRLGK